MPRLSVVVGCCAAVGLGFGALLSFPNFWLVAVMVLHLLTVKAQPRNKD